MSARQDADNFIIRAAQRFKSLAHRGVPTLEEWESALNKIKTDFWSLNNLAIDTFAKASIRRLQRSMTAPPGFQAALLEFKVLVEQQQRQEFGQPPKEQVGRGLLLAFLTAKGFKVRKEVISGAGQTDILSLEGGEVVETKIFRSPSQFDDGLDELCEYLDSERSDEGFYVVFGDKHSGGHKAVLGSNFDSFWLNRAAKRIYVVPVNISRVRPSEVGYLRRRRRIK